jgi:tetratricopeptide (TPR) repeat protein
MRSLDSSGSWGAGAVDQGAPEYWAFISYSHRDAPVAAALQRALETYRVPARLVGRPTPLGSVPAFLKPVFRDREELQAGGDLGARVREALSRSRYLVVVCSPDAARSDWVNREIVEFKAMHGEARVLAVIASGEPFSSARAGREGEECFPQALRFALTPEGVPEGAALEPIAADLRPGGDSRRLALLKLVAGMLRPAVGLDELVGRDAKRRVRRMATIAAASFAGMAAMGVLTAEAIRSRMEAHSQRAQAEDLVEFMLGDLRRKLDPVGRLDALDAVGAKALAYYGNQDAERLDARALGHRSRALHLIGEIREQRGNLEEALAAFESAADTTAQLLARAPDDGARIFEHAQSVYWVGYVAWRRGKAEAAEKAFLQYRDLARRLVRIDAANPDWQLESAYASQNLGVVWLDGNRVAEALASFSETRDAMAGLVARRPAVAPELAEAYGWIAKAHEAGGDYGAAIAAQQARLEVLRHAPDADKDKGALRSGANASFELARLRLNLGDATAARADALASVEKSLALVATDASNLFWLSEACFNRLRLAEVELALGRPAAALAIVERAEADAARLLASDATALNWHVGLQGILLALKARIALADGRASPGGELDAYLARVRAFESSGVRLNRIQAEIAGGVELAAGDVHAREARHQAARERWREAVRRLQPLSSNDNFPVITLLARARLRLGEEAEARALAARVEASKYRHPAYAGLSNELARAGSGGRFIPVGRGR